MKTTIVVAAACLCLASLARAGDGYVTGDVDLRAGPDPAYPTVATLNAGTPVAIQGCVANWSWCDIATASDRGWVAGDFLEEDYDGRRVVVPAFGVQIGIPIVAFSFDAYWGAHYHNERYEGRPWYSDRARWAKIRPRYAPPMRHPIDPNAGKGSAKPVPRAGAAIEQTQGARAPVSAQRANSDHHDAPASQHDAPARHESAQPAAAVAAPAPPAKPAPPHAEQGPPATAQRGEAKSEPHSSAQGKDREPVRKDDRGSDASGKDADPNKHLR